MTVDHIGFKESGSFPKIFCDYIDRTVDLEYFYKYAPSREGFWQAIQEQNFPPERRRKLVEVLRKQYKKIGVHDAVTENLDLLERTSTFTVTTGHQLSLAGGPLFWIYKLITTVKLAERLREMFPDFSFVPVYWLASEDHDFEEIRTVRLFGKDYRWEEEHKGPLGRVSPSSLATLFEQFPERISKWEEVYKTSSTLAEATRKLADLLLGDRGLLVLDPDEPSLKKQWIAIVRDDLFRHSAHEKVQKTSDKLSTLGYIPQVHPREINLFYIEDGLRERIVREGERFRVLNTERAFSDSEMSNLAEQAPEKFSPNVVLRPLYQQIVLPNIAYVGGPSEIAYWLQLKDIFEHYEINYPILFPRLSAVLLRRQILDKMKKLGLSPGDIFRGKEFAKNKILKSSASDGADLVHERAQLKNIYAAIREKAEATDKSLSGFVGAEEAKALKALDHTAHRIKKAEEQKHEIELRQAEAVYDAFFPDETMQERKESLLSFCINHPALISKLLAETDPFDFHIQVIEIS